MAEYAINLNTGKTDEKGIFRLLGKLFNQSGVVESTALTVAAQTTPDMTVKVSGSAASDNAVFITTNGDTYHGWNTASYNVTITANSSGSIKYDAVVAYVDTSAGSSTANNPAGLKFIAVRGASGTATTTEINAATSSKPWIRLADVTVGNGVNSINSGNIADARPRAAVKPSGAVQTATLSLSLNDAAVTSFSATLVTGSAANGTYRLNGTVNISGLSIPAAAFVLTWSFWVVGVGNTNPQGVVPVALTSTFNATGTNNFYCQIAGNDTGFPNLTNSHIEGFVRYIP